MVVLSPKAREHGRRMLEHQAKLCSEQPPGEAAPADRQMKMPLVGLAKPPAEAPKRIRRPRKGKAEQSRLEEF